MKTASISNFRLSFTTTLLPPEIKGENVREMIESINEVLIENRLLSSAPKLLYSPTSRILILEKSSGFTEIVSDQILLQFDVDEIEGMSLEDNIDTTIQMINLGLETTECIGSCIMTTELKMTKNSKVNVIEIV
jgi:hypothetical protein